ncbi:MAG: hypothetical protein AB7L92_03690 [Alphaproteobacteria bacterium]
MLKRLIISSLLLVNLSGCWLMAGAAGGYVAGRELEEQDQKENPAGSDQPEVYK